VLQAGDNRLLSADSKGIGGLDSSTAGRVDFADDPHLVQVDRLQELPALLRNFQPTPPRSRLTRRVRPVLRTRRSAYVNPSISLRGELI